MPAFIPVDRPRVVVPNDGSLAAICEPARVTLVTLPMGEPFGVIETTGDIGWLGSRLLVTSGTAARVVDPKLATVVAERTFDAPVKLHACAGGYALVSIAERLVVLDAQLVGRDVRNFGVPAVAVAVHDAFVIAVGDALCELDPVSAERRRSWQASAVRFGGTARSLWYMSDTDRDRIAVLPLVTLHRPKQHVFPEPLAAVAGHPYVDVVAGIGESGRVYLVDLASRRRPYALDTGSVVRAESAALIVSAGILVAEAQRPIQFVPFEIPTWRHEVVAWTRSGIVERYPLVPKIAEIAHQLGLEVELIPAITLCYGAHLCRAPGVPAEALAEILGERWPDEVSGAGLLAKTGLLVFADGWISLAPTYCAALDDVI